MMYILKFILLWLLPPGCIVLLLAVLAVYLLRHKARGRYALALITFLLYLASLMPVANVLTRGLEGQYTQHVNISVDAVAVLGAGAVSGVPDVDGEGAVTAIGMNRLITGVRLQRMLDVPLIVSGTGIEVIAYPCDYMAAGELYISAFSFVPQSYALDLNAMVLKEYIAITANKFL